MPLSQNSSSSSLLERIQQAQVREQKQQEDTPSVASMVPSQPPQPQEQPQEQPQSSEVQDFASMPSPGTAPDPLFQPNPLAFMNLGGNSGTNAADGISTEAGLQATPMASFLSVPSFLSGNPRSSHASDDNQATQRLLGDSDIEEQQQQQLHRTLSSEYSMKEYFQMFIMDVYVAFRSTHIVIQAIIVVGLMWIAWKLL